MLLLFATVASAQQKQDSLVLDSIRIGKKGSWLNKALKQGINAIKATPADTPRRSIKSEDIYKKYRDKHIRGVIIKQLKFEERVTDTSRQFAYFGTRLMNNTHVTTKEWVIKDNLFTKEGDRVDPYKVADNERYLRTIPFIQDARIYLQQVPGHEDSVDMMVVTRDIYSIGGKVNIGNPKHMRVTVAENNLLGMGQRLELTGLLDQDRHPKAGYEVGYRKVNVAGTFIDAQVGYSVIYPNRYDEKEEENVVYLQAEKPLVSPYMRTAGGLILAHRQSENRYTRVRPDSQYYNYTGHTIDGWVGYNIASRKLLASQVRDRRFAAIRYGQTYFDEVPMQVGSAIDLLFNDVQLALASFTFFRQDFYKTNYVYGFGVTEDIPYGYNITATGGWYRQLQLNRPYAGIKADRYVVSSRQDFMRYFFRAGSYFNHGLEDAGFMIGGSWFSRLWKWKRYKMRQYISASYTKLFDMVTSEPLRLDNPFGLQYFNSPLIIGQQRISANLESTVFLNYKFLGFRFAPFVNFNASLITPVAQHFSKSELHSGIGAGVRTRNENLVFGTIELRAIYFPRKVEAAPSFRVTLTTDLKYRYSNKYVSQPDIIRWNIDDTQ